MNEEKENPAMRKFAIAAVIGVILIFFFIFYGVKWFYAEQAKYPTVTYKGFEFTNISNTWYTKWQSDKKLVTIALRYNPYQVEDVPLEGLLSDKFNQKQIYITFDPLSKDESFKYLALAGAELSESLAKAFEKQVIPACTKNETEACYNISIVTCDDKDKAVIFMKAEGPTGITLEDNCMTLQGEEFELLRAVNKVLYVWYRIIPINSNNQTGNHG